MRLSVVLLLLLLQASCGGGSGSSGGSGKAVVENPYREKMKELSRNGVAAMQKERWAIAEKSFDRALQAAQLSNDPALIARAWYNLGMLHVSSGALKRGESALESGMAIANQHGLTVSQMRSRVALALLHQNRGDSAWQPEALSSSMPIDVHLSAARLAQLQGRYGIAHQEYGFVLRAGSDKRSGMLYRAEAHMGLALIAEEQQDHQEAKKEAATVLKMSREIGAPRLAAHALFLTAMLTQEASAKSDSLKDALAIYRALKDLQGQSDTLHQLMHIAEQGSNTAELGRLQRELDRIGEKMVRVQDEEKIEIE